ncbi:hypothetical protein HDV57DRAFT_36532 [Trichoderma longibrachiatum]
MDNAWFLQHSVHTHKAPASDQAVQSHQRMRVVTSDALPQRFAFEALIACLQITDLVFAEGLRPRWGPSRRSSKPAPAGKARCFGSLCCPVGLSGLPTALHGLEHRDRCKWTRPPCAPYWTVYSARPKRPSHCPSRIANGTPPLCTECFVAAIPKRCTNVDFPPWVFDAYRDGNWRKVPFSPTDLLVSSIMTFLEHSLDKESSSRQATTLSTACGGVISWGCYDS